MLSLTKVLDATSNVNVHSLIAATFASLHSLSMDTSQESEILATAAFFEIAPRIKRLVTLCSSTARGSQIQESVNIDNLLNRLPEVVVAGEQSSGKSTLLNRLIDFDILPTGVEMVTTRPTRFSRWNVPVNIDDARYGRTQVVVHYANLADVRRRQEEVIFELDGRTFRHDGGSLQDFLRRLNDRAESGIANILHAVPSDDNELASGIFDDITVDVKLKTFVPSHEQDALIRFLDIPGLIIGSERNQLYHYLFNAIFRKALGWNVRSSHSSSSQNVQDKVVLLMQSTTNMDDVNLALAEIGNRRLEGVQFYQVFTMCDSCEESRRSLQQLASHRSARASNEDVLIHQTFAVGYLNLDTWQDHQMQEPQWFRTARLAEDCGIRYGLEEIRRNIFRPLRISMWNFLRLIKDSSKSIETVLNRGIENRLVFQHPMLPFLEIGGLTVYGSNVLRCAAHLKVNFFRSTAVALQAILHDRTAVTGLYPFDCYRKCYENLLEVRRRLIEPLRYLKDNRFLMLHIPDGEPLLFRSKCPKYFIDREGNFQHSLEDVRDSTLDFLIREAHKVVSEWLLQKSIPISRIAVKLWDTHFYLKTPQMDDTMTTFGSKEFFQLICDLFSDDMSPSVRVYNTFKTPIFSLLSCLKHLELSLSQAFDHLSNSFDHQLVGYKILVEHLKSLSLDQLFFRKTGSERSDHNAAQGIYTRIYANLKLTQTHGALWPKTFLESIKEKNEGLQYQDLELYLVSQFAEPSTDPRLVKFQQDLDSQAGKLNLLREKAIGAVNKLDRLVSSPALDEAERFCSDLQLGSDTIQPFLLGDSIDAAWFGESELFAAAVLGATRLTEVFNVRHVDVPLDPRTVFWEKKASYTGTPADGILYCLRMVCKSQSNSSKRILCSYRSLPQIHSFMLSLDDPSMHAIFNGIQVADLTGGNNWFRSEFIQHAQSLVCDLFGEIMKKVRSFELDVTAKEILKKKLSDFLVHDSQDENISSLSDTSSPLVLKSRNPTDPQEEERLVFPAFIPGVWLLARGIVSQVLKSHLLCLEQVLPVPGSPTLHEFQNIREEVKNISVDAAGRTEEGLRDLSSLEAYELRAKSLRRAQRAIYECPELLLLRKICDKQDPISEKFKASCNNALQRPHSENQSMSPNHMAQIAMVCQLLEHQMQVEYRKVMETISQSAIRFENALKEDGDVTYDGIFTQVWTDEIERLTKTNPIDWVDDPQLQGVRDSITLRTLGQDIDDIQQLIGGEKEFRSCLAPFIQRSSSIF